MKARITTFIVNGADYFVANLDDGGVRVGMVGGDCYDFPGDIGHRFYDQAVALTTEAEVEEMHDILTGIYCGERFAG